MADGMLLYVAGTGDVAEACRLIEEDAANVDARSPSDATPLHIAAGRGDREMIEALVRRGADVNAREAAELGSFSPLHYAIRKGDVDAVEVLLNSGADPSQAESIHGFTPLHLAVRLASNDIAKLLVHKGADIHLRDFEGHNASYWAKEVGNTEFLAVPGVPPPASALAEEVYQAFKIKQEISAKLAAAAKARAGGKKKKTGAKKGGKKKKKK